MFTVGYADYGVDLIAAMEAGGGGVTAKGISPGPTMSRRLAIPVGPRANRKARSATTANTAASPALSWRTSRFPILRTFWRWSRLVMSPAPCNS